MHLKIDESPMSTNPGLDGAVTGIIGRRRQKLLTVQRWIPNCMLGEGSGR